MKPKLVPEEPAARMATKPETEGTVLELTRQMSVKIGLSCLLTMVRYLAEALRADCVFVAEFAQNAVPRVTILAATPESEHAIPPFALV